MSYKRNSRLYVDRWLMNESLDELPVPWQDYDADHEIKKKPRPYCLPFKPGEVEQLVAEYFECGGKITKHQTKRFIKSRTPLTPLADDRIVPKY